MNRKTSSISSPTGQEGIHRRLALGLMAKGAALVVLFGQQFLLVPIFLYFWGADLYRDWLVILSTVGFLSLLDFGLQPYYSNLLLLSWSRGAREEFRRALHHGLALYLIMAAVILPILFLAAYLLPWSGILGLETLGGRAVVVLLVALGAWTVVQIPLGLVVNVYRARGDMALGILAETAQIALASAVAMIALAAGVGMVGLALLYLLCAAISWALVIGHEKRRYPDLRFGLEVPALRDIRKTIAVSPFYAMLPTASALTIHGTVLLIAALGSGGVVVYSTLRTLTSLVRQVVNQAAQVAGAEMARQYAQNDLPALHRLYAFLGRLCGGIAGALSGLIAVIGPPFLSVWTLGKVGFDPLVFWPLIVAAALSGPWQAGMMLLHFINEPRSLAAAHIGTGVGTAVLCALLIPSLGAGGAAIAVLVAELAFVGTVVPWRAGHAVGVSAWRHAGMTYLVTGMMFAASWAVASAAIAVFGNATLLQLVGTATIWAAVMIPSSLYVLLTRKQRRRLVKWVVRRAGRN